MITELDNIGIEMHQLVEELYPICRSITGDGVRDTLGIINQHIPLEITELASGTKVFDWEIPREWNIKDAYVKDGNGKRIIDFNASNLHVVNYSQPVNTTVGLEELKQHVYTLPDQPELVPYRTSYYEKQWGFCASHMLMESLGQDSYEVCIDSSHENGSLTYGECYIQGSSDNEFLLSCHVCHPSLCNDNLSGIALLTLLGRLLEKRKHLRYSYRLLFIPATIGSIAWLWKNEKQVNRIKHGLVVTCVGDGGRFTYKRSRRSNVEIDRAVVHSLQSSNMDYRIKEYFPYGYDERQYCSPGFDLPVGCLMRSPHGEYAEYHTSADNLDFVRAEFLQESLEQYLNVIDIIEGNVTYVSKNMKCEPQLGKRGLYKAIGGDDGRGNQQLAMLWVLSLSDGKHTLLDMAERSGMDFRLLKKTADVLFEHGLLEALKD
ncbi:DUF4910 domain-containing protein [Pseudomonadota bacterium]